MCVALALVACEPDDIEPRASTDASGAITDDAATPTAGDGGIPSDGGGPDLARSPLYGTDGPGAFTHFDATVTGASGAFTVTVYLPSTAGIHPAVVWAADTSQPATAYAAYARRLASWGVIAILRDDPGSNAMVDDLANDVAFLVTSWLPARNVDSGSPLVGRVDGARVGLAGHGRGGQVALLAAEGAAKSRTRGLLAVDPVDSGTRARPSLGAIGIPSVFIGETTDQAGAPPCAPAADGYAALWAVAPAPSLQVTVYGADLVDFEDPLTCVDCNRCLAGTADGDAVRALTLRAAAAFFARVLRGDATVPPSLGLADDAVAGRVALRSR
jgi:dienelactone hydrolase